MISRIRIEAYGASASEVEATLKAAYSLIQHALDPLEPVPTPDGPMEVRMDADDEMVIERDLEVVAHTASSFRGRMRLLLNVADDGGQVKVLRDLGVDVTTHGWIPPVVANADSDRPR